jgi:hypothetical protein
LVVWVIDRDCSIFSECRTIEVLSIVKHAELAHLDVAHTRLALGLLPTAQGLLLNTELLKLREDLFLECLMCH